MTQQVFVISDLHLGGEPGFQMCGAKGQALLEQFIRWVTQQQGPGHDAHLVLAGDGVDFLAQDPSVAFTADESEAARKLDRIFENTKGVWAALSAHVAAGAPLTVMVGNHDIELSLPRPRRLLLQRLGVGRVEVLYDDEALRLGPLLVEHGNRYDDWNWVNHDQLRHVRRELSRGEKADFFLPQPGSRFVISVMNQIKKDYPFVDLLKPEDSAVPPLLAVLRPDLVATMKDIGGSVKQWIAARLRATRPGGDATRAVGADPALDGSATLTEMNLDLAGQLASPDEAWAALQAAGAAGERGGTLSFLALLFGSGDMTRDRAVYLDKLREALRARVGEEAQAFDVNVEATAYKDAAQHSADRGFKVIVYGHTHLVKRVHLDGGATYLNSGTWADLMRVPTAALKDETPKADALRELGEFADDIKDRERINRWRRQVPTFARIELGDDLSLRGADVHRFRPGASLDQMKIPDGPLDF